MKENWYAKIGSNPDKIKSKIPDIELNTGFRQIFWRFCSSGALKIIIDK